MSMNRLLSILGVATGGAGAVLDRAVFVSQGATGGTGAAGAPFGSLAAGVAALGALTEPGGTVLVGPGDYSAETVPELNGADSWSFVGLDFGAFEVTPIAQAPVGPAIVLPSLTVAVSSPNLFLRSVKLAAVNENGSANIFATDCNFGGCFGLEGATGSVLRAQRCYFGSNGVGPFAFLDLDGCGFQGSQSIVVAPAGLLRLTNCYGETSVNFQGFSPNQGFLDFYSRQYLSIPAITNGSMVGLGYGPPGVLPLSSQAPQLVASLADPQAQIDELVSQGGFLGFWTDARS